MARTSTYLNFMGKTDEAFGFYQSIFNTEILGPVMRWSDLPADPAMPPLSEAEKRRIMHIALPIVGGHVLMGTDMLESMGQTLVVGNNVSINLEPDTRAEATRLFHALAEGGTVTMALADMFWGALFGSVTDKYGVQWMVNCEAPK